MHILKILFQLLSICLEGAYVLSAKFLRCWCSASERGMQRLISTLCLAARFSPGQKTWIPVPTSVGSIMLVGNAVGNETCMVLYPECSLGQGQAPRPSFLVGKCPSQSLQCQVTLAHTVRSMGRFVLLCDPEQFLQKGLRLLVYVHTRPVRDVF